MAVTPTGAFGLGLKNLRTLLSNCTSFQSWCGHAGDASASLDHIFIYGTEADEADIPRASIFWSDEDRFTRETIAQGEGHAFFTEMSARVEFKADFSVTYAAYTTMEDILLAFTNDVGAVIDNITTLSNTETYLNVTEMTKSGGPGHTDKDKSDTLVAMHVRMAWEGI